MAFETGSLVTGRTHKPAPGDPGPSGAASLCTDDPQTIQDAGEVIRAHFKATAELIQDVYLR